MIDVNKIIEIEDNANELSIAIDRLNFIIQESLNVIENGKLFLVQNDERDVIILSELDRIYSYVSIANDYRHQTELVLEQTRELLSKLIEEIREEEEKNLNGN